ncbi:heme NO-binding domain-containing protein [Temperatibacter marinus]|uniref:Heme NO-binding domain-containing protein n=1 Tax=Temperatibacter marinus TaxID=1456591 RepID=A0AA52EEL2_9PROT|nr:heme NO-binding domain-containing protein [Temperatibacter marinus]WND03285.1 heme NO-binding domain-containing protein [Temperatibacter marinus]
MLGIVFTEFQEFIEESFSPDMYDELIEGAKALESEGAYTAVGNYDYTEILQLVSVLSTKTSVSIPDLVKTFGQHLFGRFYELYPAFFIDIRGSYDFLQTIEDHIHVEVKKLYPEAELPSFDCREDENSKMEMIYTSARPFADLAEGLIVGCILHYKEDIQVDRLDLQPENGKNKTQFKLTLNT